MKKIVSILILLVSISVFAQDRNQSKKDLSNDEMAALGAKRLAMQLDLTTEQETKLKAVYLDRIESQKELKKEHLEEKKKLKEERGEMREDRMKVNEEMKSELKDILTEEQYLKWEQLQEKRRKGRKAPMRKRQN